ncbi:unnamed protein product [Lactuca saligna]|uniref:At1g61320/AtMIF1 LRR domain-containing protein n=1 Tax=Lactuca saligna TaxID=75948 RepID=A0AA35ZH07_LACSI|nr:unnamed protein product [Lactuca saligna]
MGKRNEALLQMSEEGQNQPEIADKRTKLQEIMEKEDDDRVSELPDCLLIEILSRLPSTKYAIRTAQRLKNPKSRDEFALLVDKTLTQCRQLKVKKFEVHTLNDIRFESLFNNWIRYAISRNVEELNLNIWGMKDEPEFLLDQFVFMNSCFTDLRLTGCKLNPTGAISWENVRSLCISRVNVDEELIVNIVSGSPLLETLVLEICRWPYITSSEFGPTSLSLTQCRQLKQLKKFKVSTNYGIQFQPQLNNCILYAIRCNVKELHLRFCNNIYDDEFMLDQIVFTSSCFTELSVGGFMLNPVGGISWKSLRSLCISEYRSLDEDLIENILSGTPVLETLELNLCYGYRLLNITSKSVKNLVIFGYEVPYGKSEADIIEINAPNILSLTMGGWNFLCKPLLLNVSSLVKAHLDYSCTKPEHLQTPPNEVEEEVLKRCIMNLRHVKELQLGLLCSKVLFCLEAKGYVSPSNVKAYRIL